MVVATLEGAEANQNAYPVLAFAVSPGPHHSGQSYVYPVVMSSIPPSSPASGQPQALDQATANRYGQALRALKQQYYGEALDHFQSLYQQKSLPGIYRLKVCMGLIRTHQGLGDLVQVRQLCQPLLTSRSLQVRQWATQVLQSCTDSGDRQPRPEESHRVEVPDPNPVPANSQVHSLFHYQQLNRQITAAAPPAPDRDKVNRGIGAGGRFFPLTTVQRGLLHALQLITAIALAWLIMVTIHSGLRGCNSLMRLISWPVPLYGLPSFDRPHTGLILSLLLLLALASPWLMDLILIRFYGQQVLSPSQLQRDHPEALRLLRRACQQQGWSLPPLRLIPVDVPLCFSYGWWPRHSPIVVSQGLLEGSSSQSLGILYSYELAHRVNADLPVMSTMGLLLIGFHSGYRQLATWGDRQLGLARWLLALGSAGCYGGFWVLRQLALGLSRYRSRLCDRQVLALTQDPLALQQSLIDLTLALAKDVKRRGYLHPLGSALEVLLPLSGRSAVSPGSFLTTLDWPTLTHDDVANPYRYWLLANSSHPPLGERLQLCQFYPQGGWGRSRLSSPLSVPRLLSQKSALVGLLGGGGVVLTLGLLGRILHHLGWYQLDWVYEDPTVLKGGLLLGLGLGTLLRINSLYPDIPSGLTTDSEADAMILNRKANLPVEGQPIRLEATLIGAPGLANGLAQECYLAYADGLVKLALTTPQMAWLGWRHPHRHPQHWLGRQVQVAGWARRAGGYFWIDVAHLQPLNQPSGLEDQGPLWATLISLGLSVWGILTIFIGH